MSIWMILRISSAMPAILDRRQPLQKVSADVVDMPLHGRARGLAVAAGRGPRRSSRCSSQTWSRRSGRRPRRNMAVRLRRSPIVVASTRIARRLRRWRHESRGHPGAPLAQPLAAQARDALARSSASTVRVELARGQRAASPSSRRRTASACRKVLHGIGLHDQRPAALALRACLRLPGGARLRARACATCRAAPRSDVPSPSSPAAMAPRRIMSSTRAVGHDRKPLAVARLQLVGQRT